MNSSPQPSAEKTFQQTPIIIEATDPRLKIMVSSTTVDLPAHREQVIGAINRMGHTAVAMENGSAEWQSNAITFSLGKVDESQVYLGIFAQRYGHIPEDPVENCQRLSVTELEYRHAAKLGMPTLLFFSKETHAFSIDKIDLDEEKRTKLNRLKAELQSSEICAFFDSPEELREEVLVALQRLQVKLAAPSDDFVSSFPGLPKPPALLAVPQYTLTGKFIGRSDEIAHLDKWAKSEDSVMVVEGIGGLGKSAVTWEWMTSSAIDAVPDLAGRIWWSFYEHGTSLVTFVRHALAYVSGQHPEVLREGWSHYQRGEQLLRILKSRPYLMVLDGFERVLAAYHQIDKGHIPDHQVEEHRCECIHPPDGELLAQLLHCRPSKILISTRLFPNDLLDRGSRRPAAGVALHHLNGLSAADALALVRHAGVAGDEAAILKFAEQFGRHSLLLKVVCGLIADYRRRPLDFDAWIADPSAGGGLKLADLDLVQRRTHILHFALAGLASPLRTLLSRIAIVTEGTSYETIEVLNPFQPPRPPERESWLAHITSKEYLDGLKKLDSALQELEDRGLLQWDRQSNRYDMHPIVRAHAAAMLDSTDRTATFQTVHDHFASLPPDNLAEATELTHVAHSLEIFRCLIGAGRTDEAAMFINDDLSTSLLFHIGAYPTVVELFTPLFPKGFHEPSLVNSRGLCASLLNTLAIGISFTGREEEALNLSILSMEIEFGLQKWSSLASDLRNISSYLYDLDRRTEAAEASDLARKVSEAGADQDGATLDLFQSATMAIRQGQYVEAEECLVKFCQRPLPSVAKYRPGDAERLRCRARFEQGVSVEAEWKEGYDLAVRHRNVVGQYGFLALRAEAELTVGRTDSALGAIDEALQIVNRIGTPQPQYHDLRAWALALLSRGTEARAELEKGMGRLFAAEAWLAMGDRNRASACAIEGYRWAWGEGPPYVEFYQLQRCRELLGRLGESEPLLPPLASAGRDSIPLGEAIRGVLPDIGQTGDIFLVRSTEEPSGRDAWWYVRVDRDKEAEFKERVRSTGLRLTNYGVILASGWGKNPPLEVRLRMMDNFAGPNH